MEKSKFFLYAILIVVLAGIFYFTVFQSKNRKPPQSPPQADTSGLKSQPNITASPDTIPPVGEKIAPGTAAVKGKILSVEYSNDLPTLMVLQINEVLGYGPSTPPIAPDAKLSIKVSRFLKARPKYKDTFKKGMTIKAVLAHSNELRMPGDDSGDSWAISDIIQ